MHINYIDKQSLKILRNCIHVILPYAAGILNYFIVINTLHAFLSTHNFWNVY